MRSERSNQARFIVRTKRQSPLDYSAKHLILACSHLASHGSRKLADADGAMTYLQMLMYPVSRQLDVLAPASGHHRMRHGGR
jgi:hypothetical protein